ncbi:MAG: DUF881 domain-containing protein [Candidatus Aquicultorales bacterium]
MERISKLEKERDEHRDKIAELRTTLSDREAKAAAGVGILESYNSSLNLLKFESGLTAVKGRGVKITLGDNPKPPPGDANNYIIHDYDLRHVVYALWNGGAEAVSVNGQRLVGTSSIRCAGNTILVNSTRVASPFVVSAVGDEDSMVKALSQTPESKEFIDKIAKTFGLVAEVEEFDSISLPAYDGSVFFKESKIVEEAR